MYVQAKSPIYTLHQGFKLQQSPEECKHTSVIASEMVVFLVVSNSVINFLLHTADGRPLTAVALNRLQDIAVYFSVHLHKNCKVISYIYR